jgi:CheY-like chemotaxis protein
MRVTFQIKLLFTPTAETPRMPRILVIDDDPLVRQAAKIMLNARGHDVTLAEDGKSGIAAAQVSRFDLAIVDLFMPGIDGLEVIKAIRQANPHLPMIAASGFLFDGECPPMPNFDAMAAEVGAVSTLYKPFRPDTLAQAIAKALAATAAA